jgi:hypothetical protein
MAILANLALLVHTLIIMDRLVQAVLILTVLHALGLLNVHNVVLQLIILMDIHVHLVQLANSLMEMD